MEEQQRVTEMRTLEILMMILFLGVSLGAAVGALLGQPAGSWTAGAVTGAFLALIAALGLETWLDLSARVLALEAGEVGRRPLVQAARSKTSRHEPPS